MQYSGFIKPIHFINLISILLIVLSSCKKQGTAQEPAECKTHAIAVEENSVKRTISQGIYGTLGRKEGNCMPMVEGSSSTCRKCAVSRTILVYELTTQDDVSGNLPFFDSASTRRVAQTTADANGFFQLSLDQGTYSVFIQENGKLYANSFGGSGTDYAINPIEIRPKEPLEIDLYLDYAVY